MSTLPPMEREGSQPNLDPADSGHGDGVTGFGVPMDYVPRRHADVLELDLEDGLILYDRDSSLVHHLNPSARIVWFLCDGSASVRQLAQEIGDEYGLDPGPIRSQIADLVAELDAVGLLEDAGVTPEPGGSLVSTPFIVVESPSGLLSRCFRGSKNQIFL